MDLTAIGIGIICLGIGLVGLAEGWVGAKAMEAAGRNPDAIGKLRTMLIVAVSLVETCAIYGLVISILLIFVK
ncbi:MAG: ATP synthase F0 subunit C [Bacilli bacterium]